MKFISAIIKIIFFQTILFILPIMYFDQFGQGCCFAVNAFIVWGLLKEIEKLYYKNYNKGISMLYMACPLIGIAILMYIFYAITKELFLIKYYIPLFIGILIINLIYIMMERRKNTSD